MKKIITLISSVFLSFVLFAQAENNCAKIWENYFNKRGAYSVGDDVHRNVVVSFINGNNADCFKGKVRVEAGNVTSIFIQFEDNTFELFDKKFYNVNKDKPRIINGMSELIVSEDGEKLKIFFIEKVKPKKKQYQKAPLPSDM